MTLNLADIFEAVVDAVPDRNALYCEPRRLTYRELDERANRLAHHLTAQGLGAGDHVGCHLMNGTEYLEAMLACFKIRAVPINVNYRYVEEELRYLYDDADLVATVVDAEFLDRVTALRGELPLLKHVLVVRQPADEEPELGGDVVEYEAALADASPERGFPERSGHDLMMIYTGGTTGFPKGVMWRHEDIFVAGMLGANPGGEPLSSPEEVAARAASMPELTNFPAAPLMHGAAELSSFISFWSGFQVLLIRKYDGHGVMRLIEQEKPIAMTVVGDAMVVPLIEALEEQEYDMSSLMQLGSAGAILSGAVRDRLRAFKPDITISDAYGASEVGYTGGATEDSSPETGLKFRPNPRTRVIDPDTLEIIPPGSDRIGRVAQRGHIPLGYYGDEEKTAATFVEVDGDRFVLLGDNARIDAEGVIHFLGRGSVCINSGGEKIFPEEVEAAIKSHPDVEDVIVAGVPDERWGQRVAAVIKPRRGATAPTQEALAEHLGSRIARYKVPRLTVPVDSIQRSPSGKPDYKWARGVAEKAAASA